MKYAEMRERYDALRAEIKELVDKTELTDDEDARLDEAIGEATDLRTKIEVEEARAARIKEIEEFEAKGLAERTSGAGLQVIKRDDPLEVIEDRTANDRQRADALTRALEGRVPEDVGSMARVRELAVKHASHREWVRDMVVRSTATYASAFSKLVTGRGHLLDDEERATLAVATNTAGGFLVPTHLDPTVILTNTGTSNVIRALSRTETLTDGNVWNGVTSAGVTASWDGEFTEVSDDSPTFDRVSIPIYRAQAFVQATLEALQDIDGLAGTVASMFADARDRLEGAAHATGSGSSQPTGIFTALDANTNVELTSTTAATIGLVDLHTTYYNVPVRWRGRGTWLMNPRYALAIKELGTAVSASFSGDLRDGTAGTLLGKPVVESDDAPSTQTTTVRDNEIVFGDFSNYIVVDKPGSMVMSFVPHVFNTANNLPDGRSGWYVAWRSGADSVLDNAFRLLQDRTSA